MSSILEALKKLEEENGDLTDRIKKLEEENAELKKKTPEEKTPDE